MTADELQQIVLRLARWGWCRYWIHWNYPVPSPWLMAVQVLDCDGNAIQAPDMDRYGFEWKPPFYVIERYNEDGTHYEG